MADFVITKQNLAAITFGGMVLDVLGGLYLAYDLLGDKKHGFLRTLTRILTYGVLFGAPAGIYGWLTENFVVAVVVGITVSVFAGTLSTMAYADLERDLNGVAANTNIAVTVVRLVVAAIMVVGVLIAFVVVISNPRITTFLRGAMVPIGLLWIAGVLFLLASPFIELWVDDLPQNRLGVFGVCLIILGFMIQSLQYLFVMFGVPIKG